NRSERLGPRFVANALRRTMTTRQLKNRAEAALSAAVGLNPAKRARVEQLLVKRLQDPNLGAQHRTDVALVTVALGNLTPKAAERVAKTLIQAMGKTTNPDALEGLAQGLSGVIGGMDAKEVVPILTRAMAERTNSTALHEAAAKGLSAMAARIQPKDAVRTAATLPQAIAKTTHPSALQVLAQGLAAVAARMEAKDAVRAAASITRAMGKTTNPSAQDGLAQGLSALAIRMEPKDAISSLTQ